MRSGATAIAPIPVLVHFPGARFVNRLAQASGRQDDDDMSNHEDDQREKNLSESANDTAHPFDQTNGMVEGLEGDADDPEKADQRTGNGDGIEFLAAPAPGSQMAGGVIPLRVEDQPAEDDDSDSPTA